MVLDNLSQLPMFDYEQLDSETRVSLKQRAERINERNRSIAKDIWENGREFYEAQQDLAKYGNGTFLAWIESETGCGKSTAYRMIDVYHRIDFPNLGKMNIAASALYLLSAPSTPESARNEAIERAETGERITHSKAQEIVTEHKTDTPSVRYVPTGDPLPFDEFDEPDVDPDTGEILEPLAVPILVQPAPMAVHYSSATPEWYTPRHIVDRVIEVFGGIDLDPCSNSGIPNVPAHEHYTKDDNGLTLVWSGKVYMNPPYGDEIKDWVAKLLEEVESGTVTDAIALVPARTDTQWFQSLFGFPVCFVTGRLKFSSHENSAPFPSVVIYIGGDLFRFHAAFSDIGKIYTPWSPV